MKPKRKQFFAAVLAACILGSASMPVSAAVSMKNSPANEQFYEQVQNVISDYWQDDYGTEIRFTAGQTGAQVDGKMVGHEIGCEVTEDGDFLISAETFADVTGEALLCKEENPEASDFQTMCLTVQSPEMPIIGSEYGAVQTIEDSSGLYILQFDNARDTQEAYETFSRMEGVEIVGDEQSAEETPENPNDPLLPAETIAEEFGYEIIGQDEDSITFTKSFQTMRLIVDSPKHTIRGSDYGAVQSIEDGNGIYILQFVSVEDTKSAYESLSALPGVVVEEDQVISLEEVKEEAPTDTQAFQHRSWGAKRIGADQWISKMTLEQKQQQVVVAVLDTGVSASHTDFQGKLLGGISMMDKDETFDQHSHGTHVAGTVVDLTQGTNVKIMPVQVLDPVTGRGTTLSAALGVQWASEHGADVINMSLTARTGPISDSHYLEQTVKQAVENKVVVVAAAGNDAASTDPYCPAHIPELLCVSAVDSKDQFADFSNYGPAVDLAAPGVEIESAVPNGYGCKSGTSMAAPHVSAAAALVKSALPDATSSKIGSLLTENSDDRGDAGWDEKYGSGVVNLANFSPSDFQTSPQYQKPSTSKRSSNKRSNRILPSSQDSVVTKPASGVVAEGITNLPQLDTSTVQIAKGGHYSFLVKDNHDTGNLQVTVSDPAIASVSLEDAKDRRGARYRVTAKAVGMVQIKVTYQGLETSMQAEVVPAKGSLALDTSSYTMAPGDMYTIGSIFKDENGNTLVPEQIQELIDTGKLVVRDSRTGSVFDLKLLDNGNVQVVGKQEGVGYVLYEINGIRASVKITVQPDSIPQGNTVRNTFYWK